MRKQNRILVGMSLGSLACMCSMPVFGQSAPRPIFETYALELSVADLDETLDFYRDVVGFNRQDDGTTEGWALLGSDKFRLVLRQRAGSILRKTSAVNLNLYVDDLGQTVLKWRKRGVVFATDKPEPFALGTFIRLRDPAGNSIHLLNVTSFDLPVARKPRVFNVGISFEDLLGSEFLFADRLGIPVSTRAYLPKTLALEKVGAFSIVLHKKDSSEQSKAATAVDRPRIVFVTDALSFSRSKLRSAGITTRDGAGDSFWGIPSLTFEGSKGHAFRVAEVPAFAVPARATQSNTASIEDFSWIAGSWTRSDEDGILRETWSEPIGDQMMGMFQWIKGGQTWINELCTISDNGGEIAFRLRHFDSKMIGWETKDAPFYYPLRSVAGRRAIFENPMRNSPRQVIFSRPSNDALQIDVVGYKDNKESSRWEFKYSRAN